MDYIERGHLHHFEPTGEHVFYVIPSPQTGAQAYQAGVAGAQTKYTQGVQNTNRDQAANARAQQSKMLANFNQSIQDGRWSNNLDTAKWRTNTLARAGNYGASAQYGAAAYQNAATQLYPFEQQLQATIDQARASGASPIQLVQMWMDGMAQFKQQYTK